MRSLATITLLLTFFSGFSQRAIVLSSIPDNTPIGDILHLGASANGWNPGATDWIFQAFDQGWLLDVPNAAPNQFQGKVTRGDWATVEGTITGGFIPDRDFDFSLGDTISLTVSGWEDIGGSGTDLPPNVVLMDGAFFMPELDRTRRVRLFLPSDYETSTINYPVLYMHDGQNLFSDQEAFAGEWEVDEALLGFESSGYPGAIVVAIDNGGAHRIDEYTPWANPQFGGGEGEAYTDFVVNTLKPFVDEEYRTLSGREHTGIMGSSLGGLISHYAGMRHQDVFSKVGVFSPSFWFTDDIYNFTEELGKNDEMRFFFLAGTQESSTLVPNIEEMMSLMSEAGFSDAEMRFDTHADGQHSEWFWAREFPIAFEWLYMNGAISTTSLLSHSDFRIYPNPASETLHFQWIDDLRPQELFVFDASGREVHHIATSLDLLDVSDLAKGIYYVKAHFEADTVAKTFVKY